jgi:hypothetical protein
MSRWLPEAHEIQLVGKKKKARQQKRGPKLPKFSNWGSQQVMPGYQAGCPWAMEEITAPFKGDSQCVGRLNCVFQGLSVAPMLL